MSDKMDKRTRKAVNSYINGSNVSLNKKEVVDIASKLGAVETISFLRHAYADDNGLASMEAARIIATDIRREGLIAR